MIPDNSSPLPLPIEILAQAEPVEIADQEKTVELPMDDLSPMAASPMEIAEKEAPTEVFGPETSSDLANQHDERELQPEKASRKEETTADESSPRAAVVSKPALPQSLPGTADGRACDVSAEPQGIPGLEDVPAAGKKEHAAVDITQASAAVRLEEVWKTMRDDIIYSLDQSLRKGLTGRPVKGKELLKVPSLSEAIQFFGGGVPGAAVGRNLEASRPILGNHADGSAQPSEDRAEPVDMTSQKRPLDSDGATNEAPSKRAKATHADTSLQALGSKEAGTLLAFIDKRAAGQGNNLLLQAFKTRVGRTPQRNSMCSC